MNNVRDRLTRAIGRKLTLAVCVAGAALAAAPPAQARSALTQHMPAAVTGGRALFVDFLPTARIMHLDVVLPLRNQDELEQFLADVYDPSSPSYRHFLAPAEFTARFGPTQEDYDAAVRYVTANGFTVTGGSRDGMDVQIDGPVSAVETAFHVRMGVYQHPTESRTFYAPTVEPSVDLAFPLWHISGLDNYSIPHPMLSRRAPQSPHSNATVGSGPSASFLGSDMRAAYYGTGPLTGAGQSVGLLEYYGWDSVDVNTYFSNVHQTNNVPIIGVSTDGTSLSCVDSGSAKCDDTEQVLDITQAVSMAPGMNGLYVFVGSTDTAILSAMSTHTPLSAQLSCSWGWTPADPSSDDPYYKKFAAQGQNFFAASGDASTWSRRNEAWPADDPYVVSVGGTDLTTTGAGGGWASETAWVDSGGGVSPDGIAIPSWQSQPGVINSSNRGSTTLRNGPDVSANANFTFYVCADQTTCTANSYGGTSFAAPMWAGYLALVNQQAVANGNAVLGFINPALYSIGLGSSFGADFHDVTSGTSGSYSAVTGYDLVTGWGSPNGSGLINSLAGMSSSPDFTISASPGSVAVVQGGNGGSTITTAVSGGFNAAIGLSASGQPTGVTVTFNPTSIPAPGAGTSAMGIAVAASTATGTYPITVTGTGGSTTHTTTVTLTVTSSSGPTTLFSNGFESASGWASARVSGAQGSWSRKTSGTHPSASPHGASYLADFNSYTARSGNQARYYRTSGFAVGSGYSTVTLTFWMYHDTGYSTSNDRVQAQVSTNGTSWTSVGSAVSRYNGTTGWAQVTVDLSAYRGQTVYLGFLGISAYGNDCYLDDVTVTAQ